MTIPGAVTTPGASHDAVIAGGSITITGAASFDTTTPNTIVVFNDPGNTSVVISVPLTIEID